MLHSIKSDIWCTQFAELSFWAYEQYYWYAGLLLTITLLSSILTVAPLYIKRLQLYQLVAACHLVPIVKAGYVR